MEAKLIEAQRQAIDRLQTHQQHELQELRTDIEMKRDIVPVTIKMAGFDELKRRAPIGTAVHSTLTWEDTRCALEWMPMAMVQAEALISQCPPASCREN